MQHHAITCDETDVTFFFGNIEADPIVTGRQNLDRHIDGVMSIVLCFDQPEYLAQHRPLKPSPCSKTNQTLELEQPA